MRNRAKCKLCEDIIESFHRNDYVACKCDEIAIDGGQDQCYAYAKNWVNFLRVDDNGDEIVVTVEEQEHNELIPRDKPAGAVKDDMIGVLEEFCANIENLPPAAMYSWVTHADLLAVLKILVDILRSRK
jgi:hypothetical protein